MFPYPAAQGHVQRMRISTLTSLSVVLLTLAAPAVAAIAVLPLGDSITNGMGSTHGGGYRYYLKQQFGHTIDFLGRRQDGTFPDNQNEGWGGFTIPQIRDDVIPTLPQYSVFGDVILLMAGTNDLWWANSGTPQQKADQALADMASLLETIYARAGDVMVYVSTIPPLVDWNTGNHFPQVQLYNDALPALVASFSSSHDIRFVNAGRILDVNTDLYDGVHPNDQGYRKMGLAWAGALSRSRRVVPALAPEPAGVAVAAIFVVARCARRRVGRFKR